MSPVGIEPATFRFVAQHLNHCATAVHHVRIVPKLFFFQFQQSNVGIVREVGHKMTRREMGYVM